VTGLVVFTALLFWAAVFTVYFAMQGTTVTEFLLGRFEPLPPDLGRWREHEANPRTGFLREERVLLPAGKPNARWLVRQVRHRDPLTRAIVKVEPERRVRRGRVKAR
jgi:hypothetical protein